MTTTAFFDFTAGTHEGTRVLPGGALTGTGRWTGPVVEGGPFNRAIPSWNGTGTGIEVEVRAALPGGWTPWFTSGPWAPSGERHSVKGQAAPGLGRFDTDTLRLERSARAWQMRITCREATVKRAWVAAYHADHVVPDSPHPTARGVDLPVPLRSQMVYPNGGNVWCSPTSLSMVMAYYGVDESIPDQVVPGVYDSVYNGHGNWSFNVAHAGARGFIAWVDRFAGFNDLEREIAAGCPVIASVKYDTSWLPNAPLSTPSGHLLVVRGITLGGDIIVNDPATPDDAGVRLVYERQLFRRAWLDRGGIVYRIRPERASTR